MYISMHMRRNCFVIYYIVRMYDNVCMYLCMYASQRRALNTKTYSMAVPLMSIARTSNLAPQTTTHHQSGSRVGANTNIRMNVCLRVLFDVFVYHCILMSSMSFSPQALLSFRRIYLCALSFYCHFLLSYFKVLGIT